MIDFQIGDRVKKVGGDYRFEGTIVSVFKKLTGQTRLVVEDTRGLLFIFNENNLEKLSPSTTAAPAVETTTCCSCFDCATTPHVHKTCNYGILPITWSELDVHPMDREPSTIRDQIKDSDYCNYCMIYRCSNPGSHY